MSTSTRRYVSPKRAAAAEATRRAILEAFRDQLIEPGRESLSPTDAAAAAGCSVRTVHGYFPTKESRVEALAELLEADIFAEPIRLPRSIEDLPDHYRRMHAAALGDSLAAALTLRGGPEWQEIRAARRADRLAAVRAAVASIGAPADETERATAMLLALSGAEVALIMRDQHGVDPDLIPDTIAHNVEMILDDLRRSCLTDESEQRSA